MKKKVNMGLPMLVGSFLVGVCAGMPFSAILQSFISGTIEPATLRVLGVVILIMIMGNLLGASGSLKRINASLETFIKNKRLTLIFPALLMGLLPVPAGAMLSAPLVEESGSKMKLNPEIKTFLNYWFRHIFEFVWPIYPGIILAGTILNIPVYRLIMAQLPLALTSIAAGYLLGLTKVPHQKKISGSEIGAIKGFSIFLRHSWPIIAIIVLVLIIKLDIILSLSIIVALAAVTTRVDRKKIPTILRDSLSWQTILLIISVMVFKKVLENSGVLPLIPQLFSYLKISPLIALFSIPFLIGIISGLGLVVVGISFPVLLPIIGMDNPNLTYAMLAYAGGVSGYLLSPFHLCLVFSMAYFKADFGKVWKMTILPVACIGVVAFTIVLIKRFI